LKLKWGLNEKGHRTRVGSGLSACGEAAEVEADNVRGCYELAVRGRRGGGVVEEEEEW
jgi:hypothetical protein